MRKKPLPNAAAIEARVRALCEDGEKVQDIRVIIKREFEQGVSYEQIGAWTIDIRELQRASNGLETLNLTICPDGYELLEAGRRPFAHLSRPGSPAEPWAVRRSLPLSDGDRRYVVIPGHGNPIIIYAATIGAWIDAMRARGYRLKPFDPRECEVEQAEMFTEADEVMA